jgi:hypothetical protein
MAASFPTAIKSFTTKVDGVDDVQAAHINDLQDEVVAVETVLLTGWTAAGETWTRTGANTFTVPGNVTALFPTGTKIKVTDTTVKYFYVVSASYGAPNTTVTVTAGSDNTLVGTLTSPFYSYAASPQGFPEWFNWTPTFSASGSMTYSPVTLTQAQFKLAGNELRFNLITATGTTGGTASTEINFTLPFTVSVPNGTMCTAAVIDGGGAIGGRAYVSGTGTLVAVARYDNANFSLGASRRIFASGFCKVA